MKTEEQRMDRIFANIRFIYILIYMVFIAVTTVIPVRLVTDGHPIISITYSLLAIFGGLLLLVDLLYHKTLFKPKNCGLLVLFMISMVISIVLNSQYGIVDNIKTMVWTCIQLFLFCAIDADQSPKMHFKHLQILTETFGAIWLVWSGWSLMLFLQQFHQTLQFDDIVNVTQMGFYQGRLYGIFTDPNYAALACIAAAAFSVLNLNLRKCSLISKVYHYIQIIIQVFYIWLSGSRTAQLSVAVAALLLGALMTWRFFECRKKQAFVCGIAAVMAAVLCVAGVLCSWYVGEKVLSYAPAVYRELMFDDDYTINDPFEDSGDTSHTDSFLNNNNWEQIDMARPDVEESDDISNNRFQIWTDYTKVFTTAPLFGTSPRNALQYTMDHFDDLFVIDRQYSVHNTYLALLVCTGVVGAGLMFTWLILKVWDVFGYLIRRRNTQDQYYRPVLILTVILVADAVAALPLMFIFFNNMIIDLLFWVTLGYVTGFIRMSEPERYGSTCTYRLAQKICGKLRGHAK